MGMGATTGRAGGYCAGFGMPGFANPVPGRGRWLGRGAWGGGGGRGWRHRYYATGVPFYATGVPDPEAEKRVLEGEVQGLEAELDAVRKRLAELEPGAAGKQ